MDPIKPHPVQIGDDKETEQPSSYGVSHTDAHLHEGCQWLGSATSNQDTHMNCGPNCRPSAMHADFILAHEQLTDLASFSSKIDPIPCW
ncbi:hypothetical protein MUK42_37006 [Musa troglodytarum]|uniref:Uncharacterized protein n=1 Tax=Musa troglodytarum TaxID=320322 RepID=A0A9E7GXX7_9LILI|nr:hypothetical protein MUK42_37006 [Musa troglodytarum]